MPPPHVLLQTLKAWGQKRKWGRVQEGHANAFWRRVGRTITQMLFCSAPCSRGSVVRIFSVLWVLFLSFACFLQFPSSSGRCLRSICRSEFLYFVLLWSCVFGVVSSVFFAYSCVFLSRNVLENLSSCQVSFFWFILVFFSVFLSLRLRADDVCAHLFLVFVFFKS